MPNALSSRLAPTAKRPRRKPKREPPKSCGDYGGVTDEGEPCKHEAGFGTKTNVGRCAEHNKAAVEMLKCHKKALLSHFSSGTYSLTKAAELVKVSVITVWRWRRRDPGFNQAFLQARALSDAIRVAMVEDSQFSRIVAGKASPAEAIFFLKNRAPDRWRDKQEHELTGKDGSALIPLAAVRKILADDEKRVWVAKCPPND